MKLDVNVLRYLSKDDFRVLTAVEMGMRNHEIVPAELIDSIASLKRGGSYKVLKNLLKHKLVHHDSSKYDGFRLTYLGYDFLAIKALVNRGVFISVGRKIGVGKESDIFEVAQEDGTVLAMKLHRLGRESFRAVKNKRDYLKHRSNYNWLYLSRLAALREFSFMKALEEHGFAVPQAIDCNRHCVIMSLIEGYPLVQVKQLQHPDIVFETIIGLVTRLAEHGLIHCDFNEFNIMIDDEENVTMIDFPQMVSVSHPNAQMYFDRDVDSIFKFFSKRFNLSFQGSVDETLDETEDAELNEAGRPLLSSIKKIAGLLDKELAASGFTHEDQERFEQLTKGGIGKNLDSDEEEVEEEDDGAILEEFESLGILEEESNEAEDIDRGTEIKTEGGTEEHDPQDEGKQTEEDDLEIKNTEAKSEGGHEEHDPEEGEQTEEDDPELKKRLNRQRKHAIKAAKGGKKTFSSRNTYKDKGRSRSSSNSKIQKQLSSW